jgi:hypothetical protein
MKRIVFVIILMANSLFAQEAKKDSSWSHGGTVNFTYTQVNFRNWAAGGDNASSFNGLFSTFANYKKDNIVWDNKIDLGFGMSKLGESDFQKSDDRLEIQSKFGYGFSDKLYYSALSNFRSQFAPAFSAPGSDQIISNFLSPAYYSSSLGIDYRANEHWSVLVAPLSSKLTIVMDDALNSIGAFGVDTGVTIRKEIGAFVNLNMNFDLRANVNFVSKLQLFSNYMDNPQDVDVFWETLWTFQITKYFGFTYSTLLIYDKDILIDIDTNKDGIIDVSEDRVQFKQIFGAGVTYKF